MPLPGLDGFFRAGKKPRGTDAPAASAGLLRITFFTGVLLLFLTGASLIFFSVMGAGRSGNGTLGSFSRALREYDRQFNAISSQAAAAIGAERGLERLGKELDRIEKKAASVDSLLSVLKRRRLLAKISSRYLSAYRQSARQAHAAYPNSDTVAAIAAAAAVQDSAISAETGDALRKSLPLFSDSRMETVRLCLHALLGDLQSPEKARDSLPRGFSPASIPYSFPGREDLVINTVLVKLIRGESALSEMRELLAEYSNSGGDGTGHRARILNLAAEYFYDCGELQYSAELFSLVPGDYALMRRADASWLAGFPGSARNFWNLVSSSPENNLRLRALYNLALSADSEQESIPLYEKLVSEQGTAKNPCREFGLIQYSRYFEAPRAIALLETAGSAAGSPVKYLIDLELLKRRTEIRESGRTIGAVWLLLGNHPDQENLYQWGAWYFGYQRAYNETAVLLKNSARRRFQGQWMPLHEALLGIGTGNIDGAERILLDLSAAENSAPEAAANLGRIYETRHAPSRAIEYYEKAASGILRKKTASRIQFRIAHCLKTLGRPLESIRVLEHALDLDPGNLSARLELSRLEGR